MSRRLLILAVFVFPVLLGVGGTHEMADPSPSRAWLGGAAGPTAPMTFEAPGAEPVPVPPSGSILPSRGVIKYARWLDLSSDFPLGRYRSVVSYVGQSESASWNDQVDVMVIEPGAPTRATPPLSDGTVWIERGMGPVKVSSGYQGTPNVAGKKTLVHMLKQVRGPGVLPLEIYEFVVAETLVGCNT